MKKETYERQLLNLTLTDENTIGELKAAKQVENRLKRFWKTETLRLLESRSKINSPLPDINTCRWEFNLKPTGNVAVFITSDYPSTFSGALYENKFCVNKKDILK